MKKGRKEKNAYVNLLVQIAVGLVIGAVIGILSAVWLDPEGLLRQAGQIQSWLAAHAELLLGILAVLLAAFGIAGYMRQKRAFRMLEKLEDEEADRMEARIDARYAYDMMAEGVLYLLAFLIFAVRMAVEPRSALPVTGIFAAAILLYPLFHILQVNLIKKHNPDKKGVPGSMRFQKEWLKSCDEAERLRVYRAGYKSNQASALILCLGFGVTVILTMFLPIGTAPLYIVGAMWMLQIITSSLYAAKSGRDSGER